jgi:hypothetical protein
MFKAGSCGRHGGSSAVPQRPADQSLGRRETTVKQADQAADPIAGAAETVVSPPLTPARAKTIK